MTRQGVIGISMTGIRFFLSIVQNLKGGQATEVLLEIETGGEVIFAASAQVSA